MACPPVPVLRPSANISSYTADPSTSTSIPFPSSFSSLPTGPPSLPGPVSSSSHSMEITAEIVDMVTILDKMYFLHYLGLAILVIIIIIIYTSCSKHLHQYENLLTTGLFLFLLQFFYIF